MPVLCAGALKGANATDCATNFCTPSGQRKGNTIEADQSTGAVTVYANPAVPTFHIFRRRNMTFEDRDKYGMYKQTGSSGPGPALMGADTLLGEDVVNRQEEDLGDIKEIMIDMRSGKVAYAVLSFGGVLGMGEKLFAVPWQALQLDTVNKRFMLDIDKERLQSAPGFDPDAWPDMTDVGWTNEISTFYSAGSSGTGTVGSTMPSSGTMGGASLGAAGGMGAGHAGTSSGSDSLLGSDLPGSGAGGSGAGGSGTGSSGGGGGV
jgi:sporulation protein YlmC with PRC-barrel domain